MYSIAPCQKTRHSWGAGPDREQRDTHPEPDPSPALKAGVAKSKQG